MMDKHRSRRARPTLRTIADRLGISVSAVSLGLRGSPKIAGDTRTRINEAAAAVGYIYNRRAAELRVGHARLIAVCINDLHNPVFVDFIKAIEKTLSAADYQVMLANTNESRETQSRFIRSCLEYGASGLLICPAAGTTVHDLDPCQRDELPTVLFSRLVPEAGLPGIANDDKAGAKLAVAHLGALGHRRIGWIGGGQATSTAEARLAGYVAGLQETGLRVDPSLAVSCPTTREAGFSAAKTFIRRADRPTAIVSFGDLIALGALAACRDAGLAVGSDISIVGFDDIEENRYAVPALTAVQVARPEIGAAAATWLLDELKAPGQPAATRLLAPRMVIRDSTGICPSLMPAGKR